MFESLSANRSTQMESLEVRDLGPVRHAKVDVKPLTVLVGRNSSGKSIISRMVYYLWGFKNNMNTIAKVLTSLVEETTDIPEDTEVFDLTKREIPKRWFNILEKIVEQVSPKEGYDSNYLNEVFNSTLNKFIASFILWEQFGREEKIGLIKRGKNRAKVTIDGDLSFEIFADALYGLDFNLSSDERFISNFPQFREEGDRFIFTCNLPFMRRMT
ncbi:MAG: hypothetical protein D6732_23405, partial [Methanobacteriota archaeon]